MRSHKHEQAKQYDHSNHSTRRRERGDLNAPGQGDGQSAPIMSEAPGRLPKERVRSPNKSQRAG
jgi:hypothetical protein